MQNNYEKYVKPWRIKNPEKYKKAKSKENLKNQLRIKEIIYNAKLSGCSNCDYNKCFEALEFHHPDPKTKEISIGTGSTKWKSPLKIEKEIKKCIVLCANCHREIHFKK